MNDRIKGAFDQIYAEEKLKEATQTFLKQNAHRDAKNAAIKTRFLIPAMACLLLVFMSCGGWLYFTPTAAISIDVNPSIELKINRFDKVISTIGYNEAGKELASSFDFKFTNYENAIAQILENDKIAALLEQDEIMTISVIAPEGVQGTRILSDLERCTAGQKNAYCYSATSDEVAAAHELGLSYGKYRAFLVLQSLKPDISLDEIKDMTMREIRDMINEQSAGVQQNTDSGADSAIGNGPHGKGRGNAGGKIF